MEGSRPPADRHALQRILETPHLARLVPQLRSAVLHRVIQACGLEDCGELLALATTDQVRQLCDLDLWHSERLGRTETFDTARFGTWLEVLVDLGPSLAAQRLADLDRAALTTGFAQHVRVFDRAAVSDYVTTDGELVPDRSERYRVAADIGGFVVVARRTDAWDAVLSALSCLETDQPRCFLEVMTAVVRLSNSTPERDELDDLLGAGDQRLYDASVDRDERRESHGYVSVGDARAFLEQSRQAHVTLARPAQVPGLTALTTATLVPSDATEDAAAPLVTVLQNAGIIAPPPKGLLAGSQASARLRHIREEMRCLADRTPDVYAARNADLVSLANTLVAGCSVMGRYFTPEDAWEAAIATCNLGLERLDAPAGFLAGHDLVGVFQTGWTILHDDVVMYAADALARTLADLSSGDPVVQDDVDQLRHDLLTHLRTGTPWRARPRLEVLASLDTAAWAALLGLIDECPVQHGIIAATRTRSTRAVAASSFAFISERAMILDIREFLRSLPAMLMS
jgi:hypothetical protein